MTTDNTKLENVSDSELAKYYAIENFYEVFLRNYSQDQRITELDELWKESVSYELDEDESASGLSEEEIKKRLIELEKSLFAEAIENFYEILFSDVKR